MKKKKIVIISIIVVILLIIALWFSGIIPKQIGKIYGINYMKNNFPKMQLEYVNIEWNKFYGDYIITFKNKENQNYSCVISPKYFPINIGQGLFEIEEIYKEKNQEQLQKSEEYTKMIQVNGKLYINNGEESTVTARCGNMDGRITLNVEQDKIPTKDNESNFSGYYEYQYGTENTIEVKIDGKWFVFRLKDIEE